MIKDLLSIINKYKTITIIHKVNDCKNEIYKSDTFKYDWETEKLIAIVKKNFGLKEYEIQLNFIENVTLDKYDVFVEVKHDGM